MKNPRRAFVKSIGAAGLLGFAPEAAHAIEPIPRRGAHMKLSLAAYSFRQYLAGKKKIDDARRLRRPLRRVRARCGRADVLLLPRTCHPRILPPAPKTGVHARSRDLRH